MWRCGQRVSGSWWTASIETSQLNNHSLDLRGECWMSFIRNQLISKTYETVTYGYFIYFVALFTLDAGSLSLKMMIQNCVYLRKTKYFLPKTKHTKLDGPSVGNYKALFVFVFCTNPIIENFLEKITDLSVIQQPSSTLAGERRCLGTLRHWRWALQVGWSLVGFFLRCFSLFCCFSRGESIDSMMINVCFVLKHWFFLRDFW